MHSSDQKFQRFLSFGLYSQKNLQKLGSIGGSIAAISNNQDKERKISLSEIQTFFKPRLNFPLNLKISASLPLDERTWSRYSKILSLGASLSYNIKWPELVLTPFLSLKKSFYFYKQARNGEPNVASILSAGLQSQYKFKKKIRVKLSFLYGRSWTLSGIQNAPSYQLDQEISYSLPRGYNIFIGHQYQNSSISLDGSIQKFQILSHENSSFCLGISYEL